jgi:hypothetical protein
MITVPEGAAEHYFGIRIDFLNRFKNIEDNLTAALKLLDRFDTMGDQLEEFPMSGRQGRVADTREIVVHERKRYLGSFL